jgi:sporulation protein YhbH
MVRRIENDHRRFREIVRGRIRRDLRKYMSKGEMIGRKGKNLVTIPLPQIDIPRFRYGSKDTGGVGQGDGEPGQPLSPSEGEGGGEAGDQPGEHSLEVEVTLDELAKILGEELSLPNIEPKGTKKNIKSDVLKYTGIRRVGPESLRHFKRTFKEAIKRELMAGTYDPEKPIILPLSEDKRYRSWKVKEAPESNAVIIYMMDVSGSMGDEQKEIVRIEAFWIDTWLRSQYKNIESRYIVHDATAREVDQHTFYHLRESGGTKISSAYELCATMIRTEYSPEVWNIYPFHFSDGDNWGTDDTKMCFELLKGYLLEACNLFCYGQVKSAYGSGKFKKELDGEFGENDRLVTSDIPDRNAIFDSIKDFLGKGR